MQMQRCLRCRSRWEEEDLLRVNGTKKDITLHFLFFRSTSLYEMKSRDHGIRDSSEKNRWKRTRMHVSPTWIILLVGWRQTLHTGWKQQDFVLLVPLKHGTTLVCESKPNTTNAVVDSEKSRGWCRRENDEITVIPVSVLGNESERNG